MPIQSLVSPTGIRDRINALRKKYPDLHMIFSTMADNNDILNQRFRNMASNVLGLLPAVPIDGSHIKALTIDNASFGNIDAGKITTGFLAAARLLAASITANKFNTKQLIVAGLTITNNSPTAGKIAWSSFQIFYDGTAYTISSGNTASVNDVQVYWTVGGTTVTSAPSFVPAKTIFGIMTNTGGIGDEVWDKLALSGVQEDNLAFGLVSGVQIRDDAAVGYGITGGNAVINLLTLSASEGVLLTVGLNVQQQAIGASPSIALRVKVDAFSAVDIPIMTSNNFTEAFSTLSQVVNGTGAVSGDYISRLYGFGFSDALVVDLVFTGTAGAADGVYRAYAGYAYSPV